MMKSILSLIVLLFALSPAAQARVGEMVEQCDGRYEAPVFMHAEGDLSYRSYVFSGRSVRVVFFRGKSLIEMIVSGPYRVAYQKQVEALARETMQFTIGLLTSAYSFSDADLSGLGRSKRVSRTQSTATATRGSIRASYDIDSNEAQDQVTFTTVVGDTSAMPKDVDVGGFVGRSRMLEVKQQQKGRAKGF